MFECQVVDGGSGSGAAGACEESEAPATDHKPSQSRRMKSKGERILTDLFI